MSEQKLYEVSKRIAPILMRLWVEFHYNNELANCISHVNTTKFDVSKLPTMRDEYKPKNPFVDLMKKK